MLDRPTIAVITPATTFDLTTVLDVLGDVGLNSTTGAEKLQIERFITQLSASISSQCGRIFARQTYEETWRMSRHIRGPIVLANTPVASITSVKDNNVTLVAGTDYEIDNSPTLGNDGALYKLSGGLRTGWYSPLLVVRYVGGFNVPGQVPDASVQNLPGDLEDAIIRAVKTKFSARGRDSAVRAEDVTGLGAVQYWDPSMAAASGGLWPLDMTADVAGLVSRYRKPRAW